MRISVHSGQDGVSMARPGRGQRIGELKIPGPVKARQRVSAGSARRSPEPQRPGPIPTAVAPYPVAVARPIVFRYHVRTPGGDAPARAGSRRRSPAGGVGMASQSPSTPGKKYLSHTLAEWACGLDYEHLSPEAIERAKLFW